MRTGSLRVYRDEGEGTGPHEVRIKVKAIGLNRAESMFRRDQYVESPKYPAGLGYEAAGIVDAVGKDVTGVAGGDVVSTMTAFSQNDYRSSWDPGGCSQTCHNPYNSISVCC